MSMIARGDGAEFHRLILQIERDAVAQAHLRRLLTMAATTLAGHREELRAVKARIRRLRATA